MAAIEPMNIEMQVMLAYNIILVHLFSCLNSKGILPFSEAAQSLQGTLELARATPEKTQHIIKVMIQSLEKLAAVGDPPDPSKPPPPIRLH
jgi:hypothetical protein